MNRSDLIEVLVERFPVLHSKDAVPSVDMPNDALSNALANGVRVEIRGFGVFPLTHRLERIGRNPWIAERVVVPAKWVTHFKAGKELKNRV